jgi:processing peptidase subunit alpha
MITRIHIKKSIQKLAINDFKSHRCGIVAPIRYYSSNELQYPNYKETPIITRTVATSITDDTKKTLLYKKASPQFDPFDDTQQLSPSQQEEILSKQKQEINTKLPDTFSIQSQPPLHIPSNLPRNAMTVPTSEITTLDNGLRIASQETYGQVTTFGILSNCGSRLEETSHHNKGVNHLMELLAFSGTPTIDATTFQTTLDNLGGVSFASSSREQFLYCIDVLRPNVDKAMGMLKDVVLQPRLDDKTVEDMKRVIEFQWMDMVPEVVLGEGLQIAGYGVISKDGLVPMEEQQLGKSHFCPLESLPLLTAETVMKFRDAHLLNPKSMVVAGAGIEHDKLCELADLHFGHLKCDTNESNLIVPSTYTGGLHKQILPTPDGMTRVALAFETGGWHSDDLVPACVLQTLLGGGNSFSAGGPGKGMYSRLYRQVLNRYYWAESCEAFTSFHTESGLLGISGSSIPQKSGDVTRVLAENLYRLAIEEVSDEELDRARNMLKCNVLTQLESRLVLFEDLGRQILTYGKREGTKQMCDKIDAVDKATIKKLMLKSIKGNKPTLSAVGDNVNFVPAFEDVESWFKNI